MDSQKAVYLKVYQNLDQVEKEILQILTIWSEPINATRLLDTMRAVGIRTPKGTTYSHKTIKEIKAHLLERGIVELREHHLRCVPVIVEDIYRLAIQAEFFEEVMTMARKEAVFPLNARFWHYISQKGLFERCLREFRYAFIKNDQELFEQYFTIANSIFAKDLIRSNFLLHFFDNPFEPSFFEGKTPYLRAIGFLGILQSCLVNNIPVNQDVLEAITEKEYKDEEWGPSYLTNVCDVLFFQGKLEQASELLKQYSQHQQHYLTELYLGGFYFIKGDNELAIKHYEVALKLYRKVTRKRTAFFTDRMGYFYPLALFKRGKLEDFSKITNYVKKVAKSKDIVNVFQCMVCYRKGDETTGKQLFNSIDINYKDPFDTLIYLYFVYWFSPDKLIQYLQIINRSFADAQKANYDWLELEYRCLILATKEPNQTIFLDRITPWEAIIGVKSLARVVRVEEQWEKVLKTLDFIARQNDGTTAKGKTKAKRLIWLVDFKGQSLIQPKEQGVNKNGKWSKGRNCSLKKLYRGEVESMTKQDRAIAATFETHSYYYGGEEYSYDFSKVIWELVGHPFVFLMDAPTVNVELVKELPELIVDKVGNNYSIKFSGRTYKQGVNIIKETYTRYKLIKLDKVHLNIIQALGKKEEVIIPVKAKDRLLKVIGGISSQMNVQSSIDEEAKDVPQVEADSRIYVQLLPLGEDFRLETLVKPFQVAAPYFKPGKGGELVISEIKGQRMQTRRDLKAEKTQLQQLLDKSEMLRHSANIDEEWIFEGVYDCLEVLSELQPLKENKEIIVEWPKGEALSIAYTVSGDNIMMQIRKKQDWFGLTGEVKVDDNQVMELRELLDAVASSSVPFVELSDGRFMTLTKQLYKKLKVLEALTQKDRKQTKLHNLATFSLDNLFEDFEHLQVDKHWKNQLERIKTIKVQRPRVPSTFKAELRDYQKEGFRWLARLANWQVGACLADDMGLGKTIQALALILKRTKLGPTLVVAPASVARNWMKETKRFAPTLKPQLFGGGDREKMLKGLGKFDLLITSYGLMQQESELFQSIEWATIVLDEAQAIKNRTAKRTKAALELKGGFKLITTGTPIENNLLELWSLFQFINPGLLGTAKHFAEKFVLPIEKDKNVEKRQQLKKLIQPFILRRRKSQVLEELPEKTEITLSVELSKEELAFYEALRLNAMDKLSEAADSGTVGQQRIRILAEIMRLRQACCHPKMVMSTSKIQSSKLTLLGELVEELIQNGHKALIFSQFVKHLVLIEKLLKQKKIKYQYLDGSTPLKKRQERIDAFQGGEGDLFLISLKAGGVGLNLTAADYVIHMDPWWNPAVEDQASDRAHRIGQKRPVTIYRLVAQNTIEEKIVQLHQHKKDLADSLLSGSETSAKLSTNELMDLIQQKRE